MINIYRKLLHRANSQVNQVLDVLSPRCCLLCYRPIKQSVLCRCCSLPTSSTINQQRCSLCFAPTLSRDDPCSVCKNIPSAIRTRRYLWEYEGKVQEVIKKMKYGPSLSLCQLLSKKVIENFDGLFHGRYWDIIVPVPSSRNSLRNRLFNQCYIIAENLAKFINNRNIRFEPWALNHNGYKSLQAALPQKKRISNIKNAFSADSSKVSGRCILLIDDVVTTGATSTAAAVALLNSGALNVDLLAIAQAYSWYEYRKDVTRLVEKCRINISSSTRP